MIGKINYDTMNVYILNLVFLYQFIALKSCYTINPFQGLVLAHYRSLCNLCVIISKKGLNHQLYFHFFVNPSIIFYILEYPILKLVKIKIQLHLTRVLWFMATKKCPLILFLFYKDWCDNWLDIWVRKLRRVYLVTQYNQYA